MLNQVVLVGRIEQLQKDEKGISITIVVPRSYKNEDGIYENDYIITKLYKGIAENAYEYCKKGDLVGIKGRLQMKDNLEVIAEKVTFLKQA